MIPSGIEKFDNKLFYFLDFSAAERHCVHNSCGSRKHIDLRCPRNASKRIEMIASGIIIFGDKLFNLLYFGTTVHQCVHDPSGSGRLNYVRDVTDPGGGFLSDNCTAKASKLTGIYFLAY